MKMTTTVTVLDGTPEELAAYQATLTVKPVLTGAPTADVEATEPTREKTDGEWKAEKFVSKSLARSVLTRRPLSKEQRQVLGALVEAHPKRVSARDLQALVGYSPRQFSGLMGAFGRRVSHTEGYKAGTSFFDWLWTDDGWSYGLPDSVMAAISMEKLI